jgi:hypothetical protein
VRGELPSEWDPLKGDETGGSIDRSRMGTDGRERRVQVTRKTAREGDSDALKNVKRGSRRREVFRRGELWRLCEGLDPVVDGRRCELNARQRRCWRWNVRGP